MNTSTSVTLHYINLIAEKPMTALWRRVSTEKPCCVLIACNQCWHHDRKPLYSFSVLHLVSLHSVWMCNMLFFHVKVFRQKPNLKKNYNRCTGSTVISLLLLCAFGLCICDHQIPTSLLPPRCVIAQLCLRQAHPLPVGSLWPTWEIPAYIFILI